MDEELSNDKLDATASAVDAAADDVGPAADVADDVGADDICSGR